MRVGIDVRVLGTNKALERYTHNLVANLLVFDKQNKYVLFTDSPAKVAQWQNQAEYFLLPSKRVLTDHLRFSRLIKNAGVDLVFHPDNTEFFSCHPKSIVTLHDVIPWKFPEMILSQNSLLRARQTLYFKLQEASLRKASQIITVSETSKEDICSLLQIPENKITVIYEGIEESFARKSGVEVLQKLKIKGDYIFYIGGFSPHKNVLSLIKAYVLLSQQMEVPTLVLGGKSDETKGGQSAFRQIMTEIIKNNLQTKVIFSGFIDEKDLPTVYQNAALFVFPSLYEGFGFPPLEAMKASVPVVSSNRASLGEMLTTGAYLVEPTSVPDLAAAIREVLTNSDLRKKMIKEGLELTAKLTWEKTARETLAIFNRFSN